MKKLLLVLAVSILSINAYSGDIIVWNNEERTLYIPGIISPEGVQIYTSAKLIKREDGLFELTDRVPYIAPEDNCFVNALSFSVDIVALHMDDVIKDSDNNLYIVVGTTSSSVISDRPEYTFDFEPAFDELPEPSHSGVKGEFFAVAGGDTVYIDRLERP